MSYKSEEIIEHFDMDHLMSFTGRPRSIINVESGVRKLYERHAQSTLVTLRCVLTAVVRKNVKYLLVINKFNGEEMESFPLTIVYSITAHCSDSDYEVYNNKVVIVLSKSPDVDRNPEAPEMHIFQALTCSANDVVEKIDKFRYRKFEPQINPILSNELPIVSQRATNAFSAHPRPKTPPAVPSRVGSNAASKNRPLFNDAASVISGMRDEVYSVDRDVYLMNRCFEEIEKFMQKLHHCVKVYGTLMSKFNTGKRSKKKRFTINSATIASRANMPTKDEFIECYKLIKLSLSVLGRLNRLVRDPNPVDIVHAIFHNLQVIVNASRDPKTREPDLARHVVSPLLMKEAVDFLKTCLTSEEKSLWLELGDAWVTPRDDWRFGIVPTYMPVFDDGYAPTLWDTYNYEMHQPDTALGTSGGDDVYYSNRHEIYSSQVF